MSISKNKEIPLERIKEISRKLRIIDPFAKPIYDWNTARPDVKAPDFVLEPKED